MNVKDGFYAAVSVFVSVGIVILLVVLGWYLVWKLFLSRFKLVRELLGFAQSNEHSPVHSSSAGKDYTAGGVGGGGSSNSINTDNRYRSTRKVRRD